MKSARLVLAGISCVVAALLTAGLAAGCESRPSRNRRILSAGAITENGLRAQNGLLQDLGAVALSAEGLGTIAYIDQLLASPALVTLLEYITSCALAADQSFTIGDITFEGGAGLAPEWAAGPCEEPCQEWVSACLLARTNIYEIPVQIYMSGPSPAFAGDDPNERIASGFDVEEGAYYGNIFLPYNTLEYTCRGSGFDPLYQTVRVCAQRGGRCNMQWVGACGDVDGDTGAASPRHACEEIGPDGSFLRCHNRASVAGGETFPEPNHTYERVLTIHLPRSSFQDGIAAPCGAIPELEPEPPTAAGLAGDRCGNDDGCTTELGIHCDRFAPLGMCSKACNDDDAAAEAGACGDAASTCLAMLGATAGYCTRACQPGVPGGACGAGRVCTSSSIVGSVNDDPGCAGWCSFDEDCPLSHRCGHNGACTPIPLDESLLANGEPCTFPPGSNDPVVFCRGICFRDDPSDPTKGMCGSLIPKNTGASCPDRPDMAPVTIANDDLALCIYAPCAANADCTAPLECAADSVCRYP